MPLDLSMRSARPLPAESMRARAILRVLPLIVCLQASLSAAGSETEVRAFRGDLDGPHALLGSADQALSIEGDQ